MKKTLKFFTFLLGIVLLNSCESNERDIAKLEKLNDSIQKIYAPDKRVSIYDISLSSSQNSILLKGESNQPKAVSAIIEELGKTGLEIIDSIVILPDESVGEYKYAVVNNSVANIRSQAKHSAELGTQALLGMGLKVLKIKGSFYRVQTPDAYISWVDHGGVILMNETTYQKWNHSPKVIYTRPTGYVYQNSDKEISKVSDIVLGSTLILLEEEGDFYKVEYPDKRTGYLKKSESELFSTWRSKVQASGDLIELYAREFLGAPYLWGGTSAKGMDCSGFTKTVFLMNGLIIPRDASQQITAGKIIDKDLKLEGLEKGDLMFFGRKATADKKQRVTHVGIWLGNGKGEFIHASKQVRLSSIDPDSEYYDESNTKRYLGSRRYLGIKDKMITNLKTDQVFTGIKP